MKDKKNWLVLAGLVIAVIGLTLTVGAAEGPLALGAGAEESTAAEDQQPEETIIEVVPPVQDEEAPAVDLGTFQPVVDRGVNLVVGLLLTIFALVPPVTQFGGFGAIVGVVVDVAKQSGKLKDGDTMKLVAALNFAAWVILWFATQLGKTDQVLEASQYIGKLLPALIVLLGMPFGSKIAHGILKRADRATFSLSTGVPSAPPAQG